MWVRAADTLAWDDEQARRLALRPLPLSTRAEASALAIHTGRRLDEDHRHLNVRRLLMLPEREESATAAAPRAAQRSILH
jgi:hypothetical protein